MAAHGSTVMRTEDLPGCPPARLRDLIEPIADRASRGEFSLDDTGSLVQLLRGAIERIEALEEGDWPWGVEPAPPRQPRVDDARSLAEWYGLRRCIIWFAQDERHGYASYGATRLLCDDTRSLADRMFDVAEEHLKV